METEKIRFNEAKDEQNETQPINTDPTGVTYDEESPQADSSEKESKKSGGSWAHVAAAGIVGAGVGAGAAMAAEGMHGHGEVPEEKPEQEEKDDPASAPKPTPKSTTKQVPESESEPESESNTEQEQDQITEPKPAPKPEPSAPSPHIEEILVDPDDIDPVSAFDVDDVGVVNIEGSDYNVAMVTGNDGNSYMLVDVDGEAGDPNATFDIVVDSTGEMVGLPIDVTVNDAKLMADNGIGYMAPTPDDSNNVADNIMEQDINDPSDIIDPTMV